jgi:hypothetical protein
VKYHFLALNGVAMFFVGVFHANQFMIATGVILTSLDYCASVIIKELKK